MFSKVLSVAAALAIIADASSIDVNKPSATGWYLRVSPDPTYVVSASTMAAGHHDDHFYGDIGATEGSIVLTNTLDTGTTSGKAELREVMDVSPYSTVEWTSGDGDYHVLDLDLKVSEAPDVGKVLFAELRNSAHNTKLEVYYQSGTIKLAGDLVSGTETASTQVAQGTRFNFRILVKGTDVKVYINDMATPISSYTYTSTDSYFKAGCILKSVSSSATTRTGKVNLYSAKTSHTAQLTPNNVVEAANPSNVRFYFKNPADGATISGSTLSTGYTSSGLYVNGANDGIIVEIPSGASSTNAEFRELQSDGSTNAFWDANAANRVNRLVVDFEIVTAMTSGRVVLMQLQSAKSGTYYNDFEIRYLDDGRIQLKTGGTLATAYYTLDTITTLQRFKLGILVSNSKAYIFYGDLNKPALTFDYGGSSNYDLSFFKFGNKLYGSGLPKVAVYSVTLQDEAKKIPDDLQSSVHLDLANWYIGLPLADPADGDSHSVYNCAGCTDALDNPDNDADITAFNSGSRLLTDFFHNSNFTVTPNEDAIVFRAAVDGATTSGSSYPRTELREMLPAYTSKSQKASWATDDGDTHYLTLVQSVQSIPENHPEVVISQWYSFDAYNSGGNAGSNAVEILVEGTSATTFDLTAKSGFTDNTATTRVLGTYKRTIATGLSLNQKFALRIEITSDNIAVYFNDMNTEVFNNALTHGYGQSFFKVGCYTQSNMGYETDPAQAGEAWMYHGEILHSSTQEPSTPALF